MWRKPIVWLPSLLLALLLAGAVLLSRKAEAEVTELRGPHTLVWSEHLGVNAQFHFYPVEVQERQMLAVRELGLEWVRIAMHWALLEPQQDQFNLVAFDAAAESMRRHGLKPVGFLAGSAPFASSAPPGAEHVDQYPPKNPQLYIDSLLKFIQRYPDFRVWQIWNEPNIYPYWRPKEDAKAYAQLLFASAEAIKARYPDMPVATAGMAYFSQMPYTNNELMLKLLLDEGLAKRDLIVAYHPYTEEPEGDDVAARDFLARVRFINQALRMHSIKQIWATEWGWSSYSGPKEMQAIIGTDGQADYTLRRLALMSALDFDRSFLFNLADLPAMAGPRDQKYGLLDLEGQPKPVFHALKNFFAVTGPRLEPRDPPKVEEMPKDLYSIAWTRADGKQLWMFWSASGRQLTLPGVASASLHDPLSGEQRELRGDGKRLTVPLKSSLQLLVW
jgi:beta-xylosidase